MKVICGILSVVASTLLLAPMAWSADSLAQKIESCSQYQDDAARLRCFDATARALRAEHSTANAAATASTGAARPPANAIDERANSSGSGERTAAERASTGGLAAAAIADAADTASAAAPSPAEPRRASRPAAPLENPPSGQPVTARVVAISKTPTLQRRIELDNGQVWQENEHDKSLLLAAGDSVQIQSGALRSFVLRAPSGGQTHVRRVR